MEYPDEIKSDLTKLLKGQAVPVKVVDTRKNEEFEPITKTNVGYIVSAVLINEAGQVLMMQEAKYSCYGTWYLPAGRMERGENLEDAVKREVEEETGLKFEPTTLISVEFGSGTWYRFTFTGNITGGKLKTLEEKDKESLQAEWIDYSHVKKRNLKLRSPDIIPLIEITRKYQSLPSESRHPCNLPALVPYNRLIHRAMMVYCPFGGDVQVLLTKTGGLHLPSAHISPYDNSVLITGLSILKEAFGKVDFKVTVKGLISVEHQGEPAGNQDGLCMTTLHLIHGPKTTPQPESEDFCWVSLTELDSSVRDQITARLGHNGCIPVIDV